MDKQRIRNIGNEFIAWADSIDDTPTQPTPTPPPTPLPPTGKKIQVLVTFIGSSHIWVPPIDVMINGEWHHFYRRSQNSPKWNQSLWGSRGEVIEVDAPITSVRFKYEQIYDSNHNVFNYKVGAVPEDADLYNQIDSDKDHKNYYVRWYRVPNTNPIVEYADHASAIGVLSGKKLHPFYHYDNIDPLWSSTGKFRILVSR